MKVLQINLAIGVILRGVSRLSFSSTEILPQVTNFTYSIHNLTLNKAVEPQPKPKCNLTRLDEPLSDIFKSLVEVDIIQLYPIKKPTPQMEKASWFDPTMRIPSFAGTSCQ
jgi:hypothetical protein